MKINPILLLLVPLLAVWSRPANSITKTDSLLNALSEAIENSEWHVTDKQQRIKSLQHELQGQLTALEKFALYDKVYREYRSFKYDSAFAYASKLRETARQLEDRTKIAYAKLELCFTMLSSGMFKEAFDTLQSVNQNMLPSAMKADYYALMSRAWYDLEAYNADTYFSGSYLEKGHCYADSALTILSSDSPQFYYIRGMKYLKQRQYDKAKSDFQLILDEFDPASHQYAIVASTLAGVYRESGAEDKAFELLIKAAIADIKSSTTEGLALISVAEILYGRGEVESAYSYIKKALADAEFYGARQRKIHLSSILPIIEGERLEMVKNQRSRLLVYAITVSVLSLLVVIFLFIIFRQLKQLRRAKQNLTNANLQLQATNGKLTEINDTLHLTNIKLQKSNEMLRDTNEKLVEANKIKEEYIGYFFNTYNDYIEKISKIRKDIKRARTVQDLTLIVAAINVEKERESLYLSFDKIFLKIFPNFVNAFNSFFKEEDRILTAEKDQLNIELRIFALIRIGINDHERIADMLEYSVRTIYNYKTKVKNKSMLSNEEFEARVMEIKAF